MENHRQAKHMTDCHYSLLNQYNAKLIIPRLRHTFPKNIPHVPLIFSVNSNLPLTLHQTISHKFSYRLLSFHNYPNIQFSLSNLEELGDINIFVLVNLHFNPIDNYFFFSTSYLFLPLTVLFSQYDCGLLPCACSPCIILLDSQITHV